VGQFWWMASYDRTLNGASVPVRKPGPEIPADSLVKPRQPGRLAGLSRLEDCLSSSHSRAIGQSVMAYEKESILHKEKEEQSFH
jgi:hypothetical protein